MYKKINWISGLTLKDTDLLEQDELNSMYSYRLLSSYDNYCYGIKDIAINSVALTQGILQISKIYVVFPNGIMSDLFDDTTIKLNSIYDGTDLPIYLKYISITDERYKLYKTVLSTSPTDLLLGYINHRNGFYLTNSGCYINLKAHNLLIKYIKKLIEQLSNSLLLSNETIAISTGDSYSQALINNVRLNNIINDLMLISHHITHPFDAYCLLNKYIPNSTILYNHNNNIQSIYSMLSIIASQYESPDKNKIITSTDKYYKIPIESDKVKIVIMPFNNDLYQWIQYAHIGGTTHMEKLELQRNKGLNRTISIKENYLIVEIFRNNEYIDNDNYIFLPKHRDIRNIYMAQ